MFIIEVNRIYNLDCVDGIKKMIENNIHVDMVFTDPPYKLEGGGRKGTLLTQEAEQSAFTKHRGVEVFEHKTPKFSYWIPYVYEVLKDNCYAFIMCNDRNMREIWDECEKAGFTFCELLVMNKSNGVPNSYFFKSCEFILMLRKKRYRKLEIFGQKTVIDVTVPRGKNKIHPTQKPVELIIPLIEACTKECELILDPFMGSATTAISSMMLNRNWIGFEIDKTYKNSAEKRVNEYINKFK